MCLSVTERGRDIRSSDKREPDKVLMLLKNIIAEIVETLRLG